MKKIVTGTILGTTFLGGIGSNQLADETLVKPTTTKSSIVRDEPQNSRYKDIEKHIVGKDNRIEIQQVNNYDAFWKEKPKKEPSNTYIIPALLITIGLAGRALQLISKKNGPLLNEWDISVTRRDHHKLIASDRGNNPYASPSNPETILPEFIINVAGQPIGAFDCEPACLADGTKAIEIKNLDFIRARALGAYSQTGLIKGDQSWQKMVRSIQVPVHGLDGALAIPIQLKKVLALAVIKEALSQAEEHEATAIITHAPDKLLDIAASKLRFTKGVTKDESSTMHIDIDTMLDMLTKSTKEAVTARTV